MIAETANIPLEDSAYVTLFARHRIWRRVMGRAGRAALEREAFRAAAWHQAQVRGVGMGGGRESRVPASEPGGAAVAPQPCLSRLPSLVLCAV